MKLKPLTLSILPVLANAYKGDMTYYTPGLGSCGFTNTTSEPVVALSVPMMANGPNPNNNPKCSSWINIFNEKTGKHHKAMI
ncbi:MAG: hypothetical protein Q9190_007450, partial [Brigantiaea leucoxantha]